MRLLDHLVRLEEDDRGDGEAEGLGGLEVDHQLELGRLLYREVGRGGTFEDLSDIGGRTPMPLWQTRPSAPPA